MPPPPQQDRPLGQPGGRHQPGSWQPSLQERRQLSHGRALWWAQGAAAARAQHGGAAAIPGTGQLPGGRADAGRLWPFGGITQACKKKMESPVIHTSPWAAGILNTYWNLRAPGGKPVALPDCDWGAKLNFRGNFAGDRVSWPGATNGGTIGKTEAGESRAKGQAGCVACRTPGCVAERCVWVMSTAGAVLSRAAQR